MGFIRLPLLQLGLLLTASASKLVLPPGPTQAEDGAFVDVRNPMPTAAPEYYASADLLRREGGYSMGHDTCGFAAYDPALTYKCYSDVGKCENIGSYRGCCTGELKACTSTFWTQCDDYDPFSGCGASSKTRCCVSGAPYCISWMFSTGESSYTAFDCDTQSKTRTFELLATPLSLLESTGSSATDKSTTTPPTSEATGSTSASTDASESDSSTASSTPISASASSSATNASSAATNNSSSGGSSGSGTPLGAIIGGVVGGVAVIALVILGVFLIRKYQHAPTTQMPPPAPSGPQELPDSGVPSPYPPPTQGPYSPVPQYDARGQPKYQVPMAQVSPVAEAPNTPATGTGYNRAELA